MVDNAACLAVANRNDSTHLSLAPICMHHHIADILTKQSAGPQFCMHMNYILGMSDALVLHVCYMLLLNSNAENAFWLGRSFDN